MRVIFNKNIALPHFFGEKCRLRLKNPTILIQAYVLREPKKRLAKSQISKKKSYVEM